MSLRYEWSFDLASIGPVSLTLDDDGGGYDVTITSGTYAHTALTGALDVDGNAVARYAGYLSFASALESALNTVSSAAGTYTVTYDGSSGYTISHSAGAFYLSFGLSGPGALMRQVLGFAGDRSASTSHSSDVRPHFVIIPTIEGRSAVEPESEPDDIAQEGVADDGSAFQISRESVEVWSGWQQTAEPDEAPTSFSAAGTPVYVRSATPAVSWTYQHAWRHARLGDHPFLVIDTGSDERAVHQFRADGAAFRPIRFAAPDYPLWTLEFRTRLIGRLP